MTEDLARLAHYVVARRVSLGIGDRRSFSADTGVTDRTLGKLENGTAVSPNTYAAVENRLGWKPGSCARIIDGGEPETIEDAPDPPANPLTEPEFSDPTLQYVADTPGLPPDVVRGLVAFARNWRDRELRGTTQPDPPGNHLPRRGQRGA